MNVNEVVTQINQKAGFRTDVVKAKSALTLALTYLESQQFHPWFLLSELVHTNTTANEDRVPLPADFLIGYEEGELYLEVDDLVIALMKTDFEDIQTGDMATGLPCYYALTNGYYRLYPTPDREYKLKMIYYKKSRKAWDDSENVNLWLVEAPRLAIACAASILMEDTRDEKGMAIQDKVKNEELRILMNRSIERRETNLGRERGLN